MAFQGVNGKWTCYTRAREEQAQFVFYSICSVNAPENKRQSLAEFLTRANFGMIIGNFELDFASGEISYKTSVDVEGDRLSFLPIEQLVYIIQPRYTVCVSSMQTRRFHERKCGVVRQPACCRKKDSPGELASVGGKLSLGDCEPERLCLLHYSRPTPINKMAMPFD